MDRKTDKLSGGGDATGGYRKSDRQGAQNFLMDEPLSNLDAKLCVRCSVRIKGPADEPGATFLYVTHDQVEAMTMGERIGLLNKGRLIQVGTPYEDLQ